MSIPLLLAVAWEGCNMGLLKTNLAMPIWSGCWKFSVLWKLDFHFGVFRLGGVSLTSRPRLMYHFVTNLGLSQPLLIYRHWSVVRMLPAIFAGGGGPGYFTES